MPGSTRLVAGEADTGIRLDQFITSRLPDLSRSQVQRLIRDGRVHTDPHAAKPGLVVAAGLTVDVDVPPPLPAGPARFILQKGQSQSFRATWNWANYTGIRLPYIDKPVEIRVFHQDGRGEIFETRKPLTRILITEHKFDPSISVNHFNLTVENLESSATYVNITSVSIDGNIVPDDKVSPALPYTLNPGDNPVLFQCFYNWTMFMGKA